MVRVVQLQWRWDTYSKILPYVAKPGQSLAPIAHLVVATWVRPLSSGVPEKTTFWFEEMVLEP